MEHKHSHDYSKVKVAKLKMVLIISVFLLAIQLLGSYLSDSLTVLSNAAHSLSDVIVILISYAAAHLSYKKYSVDYTYGYKRAEILATAINGVVISLIAIELLKHAVGRIGLNDHVEGETLVWVAIVSIIIKSVSVLILRNQVKENMNIKAVVIHLASDVLVFITMLVSGVLIRIWGIYWIDTVLSILISLGLLYFSVTLLKEALLVFMQFTPKGLDLIEIEHDIEKNTNIKKIHHLHAWKLNDKDIHFQANIIMEENLTILEVEKEIKHVKEILLNRYGVNHSILEPEFIDTNGQELVIDESK